MIEKFENDYGGYSILTLSPIYKGDVIFTAEDIVSDEEEGWIEIPFSILNIFRNSIDMDTFTKFCYNVTESIVRGPIDIKYVLHASNFIDHSCDPNVGLDVEDNWIALRNIDKDEVLNIDYGTLLFNPEHRFDCLCRSTKCRGRISPNDWKFLCLQDNKVFPSGTRDYVNKYMNLDSSRSKKFFSLLKMIFGK
jgi:hypothetical protein